MRKKLDKIMDAKRLPAYAVVAAVFSIFAFSAAGCEKSYDKETNLVISSWIRIQRTDTVTPYARNVVVYGYYADTMNWRVEDYEAAAAGVLTNIASGETKAPDFVSTLNAELKHDLGLIPSGDIMLVACDTYGHDTLESKMYAYRNLELVSGLSALQVALVFEAYDKRSKYMSGKWIMCNDNPLVDPVEPEEPEGPGDPGDPGDPQEP